MRVSTYACIRFSLVRCSKKVWVQSKRAGEKVGRWEKGERMRERESWKIEESDRERACE